MKCTQCDKPNAKRDHKASFRGRTHWVAFCSHDCRAEYFRGKAEYADAVNKNDPFRTSMY